MKNENNFKRAGRIRVSKLAKQKYGAHLAKQMAKESRQKRIAKESRAKNKKKRAMQRARKDCAMDKMEPFQEKQLSIEAWHQLVWTRLWEKSSTVRKEYAYDYLCGWCDCSESCLCYY